MLVFKGIKKFTKKPKVHWNEFFIRTIFGFTEPDALPWFTPNAVAGRFLVMLWGMTFLVFNMSFNSNLRAALLKPTTEKPVDSILDGIERGTNMWAGHAQPDPDDPDKIDHWFLDF